MKTFISKYFIFIVIIIALIVMLLIGKCNNTKLQKDNELKAIELSTLNDSVETVIGKHGEVTAKLEAVKVEAANTRKALETAGFEIKNLKARDIEWRKTTEVLNAKLEAANHGTITLRDTIYVPVTGNDTIKGLTGQWSDGYLFLKPFVYNYTLDFNYHYETGINSFVTANRKQTIVSLWLTDPKDINIQNPYGKITKGTVITFDKSVKWYEKPWVWGLAGFAGGYYLGTR